MGPGMMGGDGGEAYAGLDLSAEQRKKIADIQQATAKAQWQLMGTMHEQGYHMYGMVGPGAIDEAAARKSFETMTETRKAMFEMQLEARKKIDAVLTPQQREQLRRNWATAEPLRRAAATRAARARRIKRAGSSPPPPRPTPVRCPADPARSPSRPRCAAAPAAARRPSRRTRASGRSASPPAGAR